MDGREKKNYAERRLLRSDQAVMKLLLEGKSRESISGELQMPMGTVNTCCTRIYRYTGCKNRVELLLKHR